MGYDSVFFFSCFTSFSLALSPADTVKARVPWSPRMIFSVHTTAPPRVARAGLTEQRSCAGRSAPSFRVESYSSFGRIGFAVAVVLNRNFGVSPAWQGVLSWRLEAIEQRGAGSCTTAAAAVAVALRVLAVRYLWFAYFHRRYPSPEAWHVGSKVSVRVDCRTRTILHRVSYLEWMLRGLCFRLFSSAEEMDGGGFSLTSTNKMLDEQRKKEANAK